MKKIIFTITISLWYTILKPEILILTYHHNRPDLIELQYHMLKKFLRDDFKVIVFNDAAAAQMQKEIDNMCAQLGIESIHVPQELHTRKELPTVSGGIGAIRHGNCINYSLRQKGFTHNDIVLILDGDMFLIREFSIRETLENNHVAAWIKKRQQTHLHFCPVFCAMNMPKMPEKESINFLPAIGLWGDTGAHTFPYWEKHRSILKVKHLPVIWPDQLYLTSNPSIDNKASKQKKINTYKQLGFNNREIDFFIDKRPTNFHVVAGNNFIHYCDSSGRHMNNQYHNEKTKILRDFLTMLLED